MTRGKAAPPFVPFADDASVRTLSTFSVENGATRIALHGSLDITRDREGLRKAKALKAVLDAVVSALEGESLPDAVPEEPEASTPVKNPFA
ncbi:hypothetical protein [Methylobacterium sp. Leaf118]|uniref:hypothetical protein n=1 Tax=Methylobacterium sp. Leaf118 TaxID=2876562 RepID=UPI001E2CEA6E|nr:hypothetical protein [Methylobacterium sp. Leaf118]